MPIVTHSIETSVQPNGGSNNVLRMYDQDGKSYMISFYAPAGLNVDAFVSNQIAGMDVQLAEQEFEQLVGAA